MAAVIAVAKPPPMVTRNAARPSGAPPRWPPNAPRTARLTRDNPANLHISELDQPSSDQRSVLRSTK
jgi:hypothetical protein